MNKNNKNKPIYQTKYEKQKIACIKRLVTFLYNKYNGMLKDKGYGLDKLTNDISKNITEKEIKEFNLNTSVNKYEKILLEKISKIKPKSDKSLIKMDQINKLLPSAINKDSNKDNVVKVNDKKDNNTHNNIFGPSQENKNIINSNNKNEKIKSKSLEKVKIQNNNNININNNQNLIPYSTEKMEKLKEKQKDEWAILANKDHQKFLEEENQRKKNLEEQKKMQKLYLEQQIKEKELIRQKEKEKDNEFYLKNKSIYPFDESSNKHNNNNSKSKSNNNNNLDANKLNKEKLDKQREIEEINKHNNDEKLKKLKNQNENEKQFYNKQMQDDYNKYLKIEEDKKKEMKLKYIQMQKENEENAKLKKLNKNKDINNNNINDNFYYPFGNNNNDNKYINNKNNMAYNNELSEKACANIEKKEQIKKEYEAKKLEKEMIEKNKKILSEEEIKKQKKLQMMKDLKSGLDSQINYKKNMLREQMNNKINDRKEIDFLSNKEKEEIRNKNKMKKDQICQYKLLLDEQIECNNKKKNSFGMDTVEKGLNKDLLNV